VPTRTGGGPAWTVAHSTRTKTRPRLLCLREWKSRQVLAMRRCVELTWASAGQDWLLFSSSISSYRQECETSDPFPTISPLFTLSQSTINRLSPPSSTHFQSTTVSSLEGSSLPSAIRVQQLVLQSCPVMRQCQDFLSVLRQCPASLQQVLAKLLLRSSRPL